MKKSWMELFEDFEENGYKPSDIQRIVMVYEMTREHDEMLKKMLEEKSRKHTLPKDAFFENEAIPLKNVN